MQDLNDMRYFAEVVERGSFSAASRALGLPKSRLSRRIAGLESRLGVRLMQRTTRRLALTEASTRDLVAQLGLEPFGGFADGLRHRLLGNAHFFRQHLVQLAGQCGRQPHTGAPVRVQISRSRSASGSPNTW